MANPNYICDINRLTNLPEGERKRLARVTRQFPFLANDYYLSLIDWEDPKDPIRRIVVPQEEEMETWNWGKLDPSNEQKFRVAPGLQHKYRQTALMLVTGRCDSLCRYCFRKRLFTRGEAKKDINRNYRPALDYISRHEEITSVLLTGGDPLVLPTAKLDEIIGGLDPIPHVRTIRIGSKVPAYNPFRMLEDAELPRLFTRYSRTDRRLYLITHFLHPRELTQPARRAVGSVIDAGGIVCNQSPLIRGVNDDPTVLAELFRELAASGIIPYYVFQCRPTKGNLAFAVPIDRGVDVFYAAQGECTGLASRVRYCMSHARGKIEILGKRCGQVFMRFHRTPDEADHGRIMSFPSLPGAYWLDDYLKADLSPWAGHREPRRTRSAASGQ